MLGMILYDHPSSGNSMKCRILLRQLDLPFERVTVDLFKGETRTADHLVRNPDGRIPVLELDSGEHVAESAAILLYLADGTPFLPADGLARARVHQWMFFEQNRIEAEIAYARFLRLAGRHMRLADVYANRLERGADALVALDRGLTLRTGGFAATDEYTIADLALYGYVHCAADVGLDPREHSAIAAWLDRVEATPRFENDLEPVPAHAGQRPI